MDERKDFTLDHSNFTGLNDYFKTLPFYCRMSNMLILTTWMKGKISLSIIVTSLVSMITSRLYHFIVGCPIC